MTLSRTRLADLRRTSTRPTAPRPSPLQGSTPHPASDASSSSGSAPYAGSAPSRPQCAPHPSPTPSSSTSISRAVNGPPDLPWPASQRSTPVGDSSAASPNRGGWTTLSRATIHQAGPHRPDHHLLPGLEPQLLLHTRNRVSHRQRAVVPDLPNLLIRQPIGKQLQDSPFTIRQRIQTLRRNVNRRATHRPRQPPPVNPGAATRYNTPTQFQATTSSSFVVSDEPRLVNRIARNPRQQHSATPPSPSTARSFSMSALRNHARIVPPRTCIHDWTHIPMYVQW